MTLRFHDGNGERRRTDRAVGVGPGEGTFVPPVDREAIFLELIRGELRRGRLHKTARARIVRYACGMGLSPLQAGRLIEQCTRELSSAARSADAPFLPRFVACEHASNHLTRMLPWVLVILALMIVIALRRG